MARLVARRCPQLIMVVAMMLGWSHPALADTPPLTIVGNHFVDPQGHTVILRGVSSMGMGMVYGNKANPGTYLPMTPAQYVDRSTQTDATGNKWYSTAVRLNFERFPSVNPARLYSVENQPYAMPDTIAFSPWQGSHAYVDGDVVSSNGSRYRVMSKLWRADRGQAWNPTKYAVGEVVVNVQGNVYRCTSSTGSGTPLSAWDHYPQGTGQAIPEDQGPIQYVWQYLGPFGQSGSSSPFSGTTVVDNGQTYYIDNLVQWQYMSVDYTPAQALANFADWKSKVMDPAVQRAINDGLYVVITDFDFGPAHHPLRHARMLDFWTRMAASQWANHPQVIFELWNESEDIGSYSGGPGSWTLQKPVIQETVNAIRAGGANNVLLVPTPFYSAWVGEATASPLTGSNIAYSLHVYRSQYEAYSSNRAQITQALASGQAVVLTEWGDDTSETNPALMWPTASSAPPPLRQLLEPSEGSAHPAAGWFAWALTQTWGPDLYADAALTSPTPFGVATRQWLYDKRLDSQPSTTTVVTPAVPTGLRVIGSGGGTPSSIAATAGLAQSAAINTAFAVALKATVRDVNSSPVSGVTVTFTAPASGASASFAAGKTVAAVTDASGVATAPTLTANATTGAYTVTATVAGLAAASFTLTNASVVGSAGTGTWTNVTPAGISLDPNSTAAGANNNFGVQGVVADPSRPGTFYAPVTYQGLWKSTDYGQTWAKVTVTGGPNPMNNGRPNLKVSPDGSYLLSTALYPIGGISNGAWKSINGGQTWTRYNVGAANGDDVGSFSILPSDGNRAIAMTHSPPYNLFESRDGGQTWTDQGPMGSANGAASAWIDADTILAISDGDNGPGNGTWRGVRSGSTWPWSWSWTKVSNQQHWHGTAEVFVDNATGAIFMGGAYGIQKSTNKGATWTTVSGTYSAGIAGTPKTLYSTANYASAGGFGPFLTHADRVAGGTTWVGDVAPPAMNNGWLYAGVGFDGSHYVIVGGNWLAGIWRYVEP